MSFSLLTSALGYKEYNGAVKVIKKNNQHSLYQSDLTIFTAEMLHNNKEISIQACYCSNIKTMSIPDHVELSTLLQITDNKKSRNNTISIFDDQIFDSNFDGPMTSYVYSKVCKGDMIFHN